MPDPELQQLRAIDTAALAAEARAGLLAPRAQVAPKFLYDAQGARLFDAITALDEYYPTRTEAAILAACGTAIAAAVHRQLPPGLRLIDLGAGDGAKAEALFPCLQPAHYVAIDIAVEPLRAALQRLQRAHPQLRISGVGLDFSARLQLPPALCEGPSLLFYPGSSIGNFAPDDALRLLREARQLAAGGLLLIGVDLVKDAAVLQAAYDDALGLTAAFNLNVLRHLNRLIGSDFDLRQWQHVALYDSRHTRVEMHLQARRRQVVTWPGAERLFAAGERIHTENAHKWTLPGFIDLLHDAGWQHTQHWTDAPHHFAVLLAR